MYLSHYAFKLQHSKAQHYTAVVAKANKKKEKKMTRNAF
jgi:hypothetical protein